MNYDFDEIEETRIETLEASITDVISIGVGIAVSFVTAKELAKVLPKRTIAPIALAVQMAVSSVFANSITLGIYANKVFRDYRRSKLEIISD